MSAEAPPLATISGQLLTSGLTCYNFIGWLSVYFRKGREPSVIQGFELLENQIGVSLEFLAENNNTKEAAHFEGKVFTLMRDHKFRPKNLRKEAKSFMSEADLNHG